MLSPTWWLLAVLDRAFDLKQSFLLDGTLSSYDVAGKKSRGAWIRCAQVQVVYVYQEPKLAWQFVQAREIVEGRGIPAERFVQQAEFHRSTQAARSNDQAPSLDCCVAAAVIS